MLIIEIEFIILIIYFLNVDCLLDFFNIETIFKKQNDAYCFLKGLNLSCSH